MFVWLTLGRTLGVTWVTHFRYRFYLVCQIAKQVVRPLPDTDSPWIPLKSLEKSIS